MSFISSILRKRNSKSNVNSMRVSGIEGLMYFSSVLCLVRRGVRNSNHDFIFTLEEAKVAREENGTIPNYCPNLAWLVQDTMPVDKPRLIKILSNHVTELSNPDHISHMFSARQVMFKTDSHAPKDIHTSETIALLYLDLLIHAKGLDTPLEYLLAYKSLTQKYSISTVRVAPKELMELLELVEFKNFSRKQTLASVLKSLFKEYLENGFKNYPEGFSSPNHKGIVECLSELLNKGVLTMRYEGSELEGVTETVKSIMDKENPNSTNPIVRLYNERIKTATYSGSYGM